MEDEEFVDLLTESEWPCGSSQESLTTAATNLTVYDEVIDQGRVTFDCESSTSQREQKPRSTFIPVDIPPIVTTMPNTRSSGTVTQKIEAIFESMAESLLDNEKQLEVHIYSRSRPSNHHPPSTGIDGGSQVPPRTRTLGFPGKSADEAWRFTMVIRILEIIHEALRNDKVVSKRDIYYRDPALFGTQARVDKLIDDLAYTFSVPRSMLNITAVAKGLVAGAVKFCFRDGSIVNATDSAEGILVPPLRDILSVNLTATAWILVIEKEATFRSIATSPFWPTIAERGVILTGKGYPDLASRALLHFLSQASPRNGFASPPVFGLADLDPDGLAILSTYKHGSAAMAHENHCLSVPGLRWLGLHFQHLLRGSDEDGNVAQGLLPLSRRDRKKAVDMLEKGAKDQEFSRALQTMLMLNLKAEMQFLDAMHGDRGMCGLLQSSLP